MGKVLERLLVNRLEAVIADEMHEDAWMKVRSIVDGTREKYVLRVFVDFKGAFDNLCWDIILSKLASARINEIGIWRDYFHDRRACIRGTQDVV